jgi:hypothetical protein
MRSRVALGAVLLGAGVLWLLTTAGVLELSYRTWVGVLLIAIGLAIALTPGRHGLLVALGVLIALAGLPALAAGPELFKGGIGETVEAPDSRAQLEPFRHAIGKLTVDLTSPTLELDGATVVASVGIGELVVLVPTDADVSQNIHVGVGNAEVPGTTESGIDVEIDELSGTSGSQEFELELDVGIGNARVQRR